MNQDDVTILVLLQLALRSLAFSAVCAGGTRLCSRWILASPLLLILLLPGDLSNVSSDYDVLIRDDELVVLIELILNIIDVLNSTTMMHIRSWLIMRYMNSLRMIRSLSLSSF